MPPPDTTYIPGQTGPPPLTGDPYIDSVVQTYWTGDEVTKSENKEGGLSAAEVFFMLLMGVFFVMINKGAEIFPGIIGKRRLASKIKKMYTADGTKYHKWLLSFNPYYKSLPEGVKHRFLERTLHFVSEKQFKFHYMEPAEHIPVLIAGAAVQLTFGLKNYMLDHYPVIHVIRKEYERKADRETYYGHVSRSGIYISWSHFLAGYSDYSDSENVGLHEMAHALQFDAYLGLEDVHDRNFKERLNAFSDEGRPIFRAMRKGASHLLDDYATTNFDEFWAVSVETFFENPVIFKDRLPGLYQEISELLNQDPLLEYKVVDPDLL
ncbi:MAG TPA: zinc-dependent peptidase [Chitinophagaceae bacterium]|nr:zinc-dependent peptidase [Chitinophagaceae bacterium]HNU15915.1 zinc-dependent peptidase [Chitinophagaceae bacterium]